MGFKLRVITLVIGFFIFSEVQGQEIYEDGDSKFLVGLSPNLDELLSGDITFLSIKERQKFWATKKIVFKIECEINTSKLTDVSLPDSKGNNIQISIDTRKKLCEAILRECKATITIVGTETNVPKSLTRYFIIYPVKYVQPNK